MRRFLYLTRPPLRGEDVLALQRALKAANFDPYILDGVFGPMTEAAVIGYQKSQGLPPDGVAGPEVFASLGLTAGLAVPQQQRPVGRPGEALIRIEVDQRRLLLLDGTRPLFSYPIAVGKPATPSPRGEWVIRSKILNPGDGLGTRWMGLNVPWGNYGIHGTFSPWSIGRAVSNGCIRLYNHDVEVLFDRVEVGAPVKIL